MDKLGNGIIILSKYDNNATIEIDYFHIRFYTIKEVSESDKNKLNDYGFTWFESEYCWKYFDKLAI